MKTTSIILSALTAGLIFTGCNTTATQDTQKSTSLVRGLVPGTLIEAFCADGSYHRVNSNHDGTSRHPFEIEVPRGVECNFVMTTNENNDSTKVITPISFTNADSNGTFITINGDVLELDYIDLAMDRADIEDNNKDGVIDVPLSVDIDDNNINITPPSSSAMDSDNDGIIDLYEDDDNDHIPNHHDDDDDNDGILDIEDYDHDNDGINDNDNDHDGIRNEDDIDDDNDGIDDSYDDDDNNDGIKDNDDDDLDDNDDR